MKVLEVLGSRNPEGQTARAAGAFAAGASSKGADVEQVFLPGMDIGRCRQCDNEGWGICRIEGRCVNEDEMVDVVEKMTEAHAFAFATPVYFCDVSESMRTFLDRLRRICTQPDGRARIAGKPAVGICVAGGAGGGGPECAVSLEKHLSTSGFDVVDMVPARRQNLQMKLDVLRLTGEWVSSGMV